MRRFLFLALLVLVLPGCAAHKITERDSFFSVSKDGKPVVSVTLEDGFVFAERQIVEERGASFVASTYFRGKDMVLLGILSASNGGMSSAERITGDLESSSTYAVHYPSRIPIIIGSSSPSIQPDSGEFISWGVGVLMKYYFYLDKKKQWDPLVVVYFNMETSLSFDPPKNGESLTPEQRAEIEEFSKRADAAFKGIRFAQ